MWKYVTRRLKETFERTCNALDLYRTWRCGGGAQQASNTSQDNDCSCEEIQVERDCVRVFSNFYICPINGKSNRSSDGGPYEKKGRTYQDNYSDIQNDLLGAIKWSGAIVCGWYASQLLCLNRRQYGWDRNVPGYYFHIINTPSRAIHSNILSHLAFASPTQPSLLSDKTLKEKYDFKIFNQNTKDYKQFFNAVEISNDSGAVEGSVQSDSTTSSQKQTVSEAVSDLVKFLGETEFKLGIQHISARRYRSAVTHLKLASRHHHVGATFNLGVCYEQGLGVTKNLKRAMECYQYASSMGHPKAMYNLGVFYAQGLGGLEKDLEAARQCFIAAAKLGQNEAKSVLGWPAENKVSVPPLTKISKQNDCNRDMMKITSDIIEKSL